MYDALGVERGKYLALHRFPGSVWHDAKDRSILQDEVASRSWRRMESDWSTRPGAMRILRRLRVAALLALESACRDPRCLAPTDVNISVY